MKKFLILFWAILYIQAKAFAQTQAFAICSTGILESKYKITYYPESPNLKAANFEADTISLAEAQSIFALNVIGCDTNKIFVKLKVNDWDLFLKSATDTVIYRGNGERLTSQMKDALKKTRAGTEIYFEKIMASWGDRPSPVKTAKYIVR